MVSYTSERQRRKDAIRQGLTGDGIQGGGEAPAPTRVVDPAKQLAKTAERAGAVSAPAFRNGPPRGLLARMTAPGGVPGGPGAAPAGRTGGPPEGDPRRAPGTRSVGGHRPTAIPGVSGRLTGLLSGDSRYLQQARQRAARAANRRGLRNSSIAAGAGEEAAIAAALPIAQADASIAAGERALESQEFQQARQLTSQEAMQARDHRVQQLMQERGLSHEAAQNQANRELEDLMQRRGITSQEAMQQRQIRSTEEIAGKSRALQDLMQRRQIGSNEMMQARDLRTREIMQQRGLTHEAAQRQADRELTDLMQTRQIESNERVSAANRELQDLINQRNIRSQELMQSRGLAHDAAQRQAQREMQSQLAAAERNLRSSIEAARNQIQRETLESSQRIATMNAQSRNYGTYQQSVDRINANADLPADERAEQLKQVQQTYDATTSAQQQISGVEYDWPTYDAG